MPRPIQARIATAAIRHNYLLAKKYAARGGESVKAWAVVKANAYGHGLLRTARALGDVADGFALLDLSDAVTLRDAGFRQPILLLEGVFEARDVHTCAEYRLTPAIHCLEQLKLLQTVGLPGPLPIYLKLNTGMNRLGFTFDQISSLRAALERISVLGEKTLMTHFSDADGERGVAWQLAHLDAIRNAWPEAATFPVSMANSAALMRHPETVHGWVRPGIMIYGGSPFTETLRSVWICSLS